MVHCRPAGAPATLDPMAAALELEGLKLEDERPLASEEPKGNESPEGEGGAVTSQEGAVTSQERAVTSREVTSEAAVTSVGQLMFSHRTHRRLILLGPRERDPPCVLALQSSLQGAIGLQRSGSLPRRRGGDPPVPPPAPRPHSGVLALQLDPEAYSTCVRLAELERRLREAVAERERLLRAREARRAAKAPPPPETAPPPPQPLPAIPNPPQCLPVPPSPSQCALDLRGLLRARGHRVEGGGVRVSGGSCRGPLTKMGGRIKTWRRRWFHLDPQRRLLAYYRDREERQLKGVIYFQAIQEVFPDHGRVACKSPNPRLTFCLKTLERLFCLVAPSPESLRLWIDAISAATQWAGTP